MDICYIVGTGSNWRNWELRYSLRSIDKYGINVDKVVIVGNIPHFVNQNEVICIPCDDIDGPKHNRILHKILIAVNSGKLSNDFLISSDDHFYVKPTDFNNLPVYYKNEVIKGGDKNSYHKSLSETKEFLQQNGLTTYQTNPHCNTHFNIEVYNKYKDLFELGKQLPNGIESNCLMGNLLIKEGYEPEYYNDVKVKSLQSLKLKLQNSECFSIYDCAIRSGIQDYLEEQFPDKCKYEI